jgi:tetratricopeptide (TPR) repeat protein
MRRLLLAALVIGFGPPALADDCRDLKVSPEQAIAACSRIITSKHTNVRQLAAAFNARGIGFDRAGDHDRAFADFNQAIQLNPSYSAAYTNRGLVYAHKADFDRAIADHNKALRLNPKYAVAFNNRASAYSAKGDRDRALADLDEAIRLSPKFAIALKNRGGAYRARGDLNRAVADYSEAIKVAPKFSVAYALRGPAYEAMGDHDRAKADFRMVLSIPSDYEAGKLAQDVARQRLAALSEQPVAIAPPVSQPATTAHRVALVIGNDRYPNLPADAQLRRAANDAKAVGEVLGRLGFRVIIGTNLGRQGMIDKLSELVAALAPGDTAAFFYAGHGIAVGGANYLLPSDVPPRGEDAELRMRAASIAEGDVVAELQKRRARVALLVHRFQSSNHIRRPCRVYRTKCGRRGVG